LENIYWLPAWISSYSATDFPRVQARFKEIFDHGLSRPGDHWQWDQLDMGEAAAKDSTPEDFIRVATILINQLGYRGASVDRITAELNVTKGSFYHHLDAKDDLVMDCFERSYGYVSDAQRAAMARGGGQPAQLAATMATLLATQLYQPFPLLRTTALQVIPSELRGSVIERSNRMALRFASMMIDGISEGSVRAVDPVIASQMIMATLNAAFELRHWAEAFEEADGISLYGSTLAYGLFDPAIQAPL
jgi:AcrR family transcriptional regulator